MKIYASPFNYILPLFAFGIVSSSLISSGLALYVLFFTILSLIVLYRFNRLAPSLNTLGFALAFWSLGASLGQEYSFKDEARIESEPSTIVEITDVEKSNKRWKRAIGKVIRVEGEKSLYKRDEQVLFYTRPQFVMGDLLLLKTGFETIKNSNNPGEFDAKSYWNNKDVYQMAFIGENDYLYLDHKSPGVMSSFLADIRADLKSVIEANLSEVNSGIAKALLLGDKGGLSIETRNSFSSAGAMHVLAVSGLHVGIIMYVLLFVLSKFSKFISRRSAVIICILFVWFYAGVTGFSPSVMRASFMFSVLMLGQLISRSSSSLNILFFSAFILLLFDPLMIYDIGFQLSYLALIGILLLYKPLCNVILIKNKWGRKVWEGTAVGIAAQVFTVPLTLYYFHQFPNYFMLSNLGIMLFAGVLLVIGLLVFLFKSVPIFLSFLSVLLGLGICIMLFFIQFIESLPGAVATGFEISGVLVFLIYVILFTVYFFRKNKWVFRMGISSLILLLAIIQFGRMEHMMRDEIILFNSNVPIISVKSGGEIICLYDAKPDELKKVKFLMESYAKVRPGKIEYVRIKKGKTSVKKKNVNLVIHSDGKMIEITCNDQKRILRRGYGVDIPQGIKMIDMPYLESPKKAYNLSKGALYLSAN